MILNTGDFWQPEEGDIIQWQRTYPAVDVHAELAKMESWLDANPAKRKTSRGIKRFVNSWLSRAQDSGGSSPAKLNGNYGGLRSMSVTDELTDVSWVPEPMKSAIAQKYLRIHGQYWDGERKTA